jgi:hypothetical protein
MSGSANVIKNMWAWATLKRAGIEATSLNTAGNMENWAKVNSPWNSGPPNSGNARAGLHAGMYWESPTVLKIYIAHGMSYGVYLELAGGGNKRVDGVYVEMANDGKYAILSPTINKFKNGWFNSVKKIMEH